MKYFWEWNKVNLTNFYGQVTGHNLDVESENFKLRNIMEADPLKYKEEIEVSMEIKQGWVLRSWTNSQCQWVSNESF